MWSKPLDEPSLALLEEAHRATRAVHPGLTFDGFHCTAADLSSPPQKIQARPVFYEGAFDSSGTIDINWVTWHELAERAIVIRWQVPPVHTDRTALHAFTQDNLDTYWRSAIGQIEEHGFDAVGQQDQSVVWVTLGVARLHHLLTTGELTSKSGAGRYIVNALDATWHQLANDTLRIRERPNHPPLYDDPNRRGRDLYEFL